MKRFGGMLVATALALFLVGAQGLLADRGDDGRKLRTKLSGLNEPPSVITPASGLFEATINPEGTEIQYTLNYENLRSEVRQSHIHIGQTSVNGAIAIWLCQTATNPAPAAVAALTPMCGGPTSDTVTGTIGPSQVLGITSQGITAGEFAAVLTALRKGVAYVNVHSATSPGGELRGQLQLDGNGSGGNSGPGLE
jgi:hypothetical protein